MKTIGPHTPIQYVMGSAEFFGLDFAVDERVLIPRPETEILVQAAIDIFHTMRILRLRPGCDTQCAIRVLDLCTGSGNVAVSLAHSILAKAEPVEALMVRHSSPSYSEPVEGLTKHISDCTIVASDISHEALEVARLNARRNGVINRIEFVKSDLFANIKGEFDIIVSNPPYIARHEFPTLQREVLKEPRLALDGGDDGLDFYSKIFKDAPRHLKKGGFLILEIGFGQKERVSVLITRSGLTFSEIKKDWNGIDRVMVARWTNY